MWAHAHVRLSPGRCCRWHKRGKTATPNLRRIAHNPRTRLLDLTAIRRLQILGPDSDPPIRKLKRVRTALTMGYPFLYLVPFTDKTATVRRHTPVLMN